MDFLHHAAEGRIDQRGIIHAVVDLHRVMIHLGAAVRADHFVFVHSYVPLRGSNRDIFSSKAQHFAHPDQLAEKLVDALFVRCTVFNVTGFVKQGPCA